jgi:hypothetical protein
MKNSEFSELQKKCFNSWSNSNVIEYYDDNKKSWVQGGNSINFSTVNEYREKFKAIKDLNGNPINYKRRDNFRFRWKDELIAWQNGEAVKFYDDKKKEWHLLKKDYHVWDCITIYEIVEKE